MRAHYCMDKQQSVAWGAEKSEVCGKCGMHKDESNGCCRDEVKVVKLEQDTQVAKVLLPNFAVALPVLFPSLHLSAPFYNFATSRVVDQFQPPPLPGDICIANSVFRI